MQGLQGLQGLQGIQGVAGISSRFVVRDSSSPAQTLGILLSIDQNGITAMGSDSLIRRWDIYGHQLGLSLGIGLSRVFFTGPSCSSSGTLISDTAYVFANELPSAQIVYTHPVDSHYFLDAPDPPITTDSSTPVMQSYYTQGACSDCGTGGCPLPVGYSVYVLKSAGNNMYGAVVPYSITPE